jgi:hypothetical protein
LYTVGTYVRYVYLKYIDGAKVLYTVGTYVRYVYLKYIGWRKSFVHGWNLRQVCLLEVYRVAQKFCTRLELMSGMFT